MDAFVALRQAYDDLTVVARAIGWRKSWPPRAIIWVPRGPEAGWRLAGYEDAGVVELLSPPDMFDDWEVISKEQWQKETHIRIAVY